MGSENNNFGMDAIMGADVNESIADIVACLMGNTPIVGEGFY